jgi:hypothetical protein
VFSAIELSTATRLCCSTNETHLCMNTTAHPAIVILAATQLRSSTCETLLYMLLRPSSVTPAIDPSAAKRLSSSTYGTLPFTSRIRKPLWMSSLPPATSYANLQRHEGWQRGDPASDDAWNRYQDALASELRKWYGAENDITAWHALCRAIDVEPLPRTCEQCEEV